MTKMTKLQQVQNFINESDYESALKIVKSFPKIRGTKEQSGKIKTAWDAIQNHSMYEQMGKDADQIIQDGIDMMIELYADKEENNEQDTNPIMEEKFINIETHEEIAPDDVDTSEETDATDDDISADDLEDRLENAINNEQEKSAEDTKIELGSATHFEKSEVYSKDIGIVLDHASNKEIYARTTEAILEESVKIPARSGIIVKPDFLKEDDAITAIKNHLFDNEFCSWNIDKTAFCPQSNPTYTATHKDEGKFGHGAWIRKLFSVFNCNGYEIMITTQIVRSDLITSINFVIEKSDKKIRFLQIKEKKHANLSPSSIARPKFNTRVLGNHIRYIEKLQIDDINEAILRYEVRKDEVVKLITKEPQPEAVALLEAGVKTGKLSKDLNIKAMASKIEFIKM